ncbi:SRPBCC family protein [Streptomyces sp. NPDC004111]|uniref:SRPBCC family protein n=1 Tax=Streptomyces sp. NPDC004111 TaxID=3364690 RepID=UPI00368A6578
MTARPRKLVRTAVVTADPARVWDLVGDFGGLADWHPHVPPSTIEDGADPRLPGAVRVFTLDGRVVARERLLAREAEAMSYTYTVLDPMLPIDAYVATLAVRPHADGAELVWAADYSAADEAVAQVEEIFGDGTYGSGLAALREKFGRA